MTMEFDNIFSEPLWLSCWQEAILQSKRFSAFSIGAPNPGQGQSSLPLVIKHRRRPTPFTDFIEYPAQEIAYDVDITAGMDDTAALALIKQIFEFKRWHGIDLRHLNKESRFLNLLKKYSGSRNCYYLKDDDAVWEILLPGSFGEYIGSLRKDRANRFTYYLNRIEKQNGYDFFFVKDKFDHYWKRFMDLHNQRIRSKGSKTLLSDDIYGNFYRSLARSHMENGFLRLACLQISGQVEGMLFGVEKYDTFYYLNSGFSENIARFSPGIVMPLECVKYSIANRVKRFNFLGGEDKYKMDLGAHSHATRRMTAFRSPLAGSCERLFEKVLSLCVRR